MTLKASSESKAMAEFLAYLIAGIATGAIYALAAIGFTLVWQTSQTINFAQGEFVMLPAVLVLLAIKLFGAPIWLGALIGIAAFILIFGVGFKLAVVDPMIRHGVLPLAIATMALSIIMKEGAKDGFSAEAQKFPSFVPTETDLGVRRGDLAAACRDHRGRLRRHRPAAMVRRRHPARAPDAGDGAEPDGGAHPRHPGRAHGAATPSSSMPHSQRSRRS
jgi:type IV secretory pathway TrbD component